MSMLSGRFLRRANLSVAIVCRKCATTGFACAIGVMSAGEWGHKIYVGVHGGLSHKRRTHAKCLARLVERWSRRLPSMKRVSEKHACCPLRIPSHR